MLNPAQLGGIDILIVTLYISFAFLYFEGHLYGRKDC